MITFIIEKEIDVLQEELGLLVIKNPSEFNHLKNSFRIKMDEVIRGIDGEFEYILKVTDISKKEISCKILNKNLDKFSTEIDVHAAIGILKNDKMSLVIQKLTEVGVKKIIPFESKRCIVKLDEKKDKWDVISKEALKQCQGVKFVEITPPRNISNIIQESYDLIVVLYEAEKTETLHKFINELKMKPKKILYIIGPEGGLEEEEVIKLKNQDQDKVKVATLGARILRAETAAIVVGGILTNAFE